MHATILAGGLGTRLRPVVGDIPKPMALVSGRPFLELLLTSLAAKGFERVILSIGYMADRISKHFGRRFAELDLHYVIEEKPLGTGGAVRRALGCCEADHSFVLNGDTYLDLDAGCIEARWQRDRLPMLVAIEVADASRYGCLQVSNGCLERFLEKGTRGPGLINGGCYVLPPSIVDRFPSAEVFSFERDFLADAVLRGPFGIFIDRGRFIDIGVPEDYARAQLELADTPR